MNFRLTIEAPRPYFAEIPYYLWGTVNDDQSRTLRQALSELTGKSFASDADWVRWYGGSFLHQGAKATYPEPDFDAWLAELKAEYGDT